MPNSKFSKVIFLHLFDFLRLTAKLKTTGRLIVQALFGDDSALKAQCQINLQNIVEKFCKTPWLFGRTIMRNTTSL